MEKGIHGFIEPTDLVARHTCQWAIHLLLLRHKYLSTPSPSQASDLMESLFPKKKKGKWAIKHIL